MLTDLATAPISEPFRATLRFLEAVTCRPTEVGPSDARQALAAGVSASALREALYVCALFNTVDRLADALGFTLSKRDGSWALLRFGYRL